MAVYDRWHLSHPPEDAQPCRCSRGKTKLYPGTDHEKGDRWQVRWRDENGAQRKRNFAKKDGLDPETCAEAFDAKVRVDPYFDPAAGQKPFRPYAEDVITNRSVDVNTRAQMRGRMAKHVYPVIGDTALHALSRRPSLIQSLVASMERAGLGASTLGVVMADVGMVFNSAIEDGLIARNPCRASSVRLPMAEKKELTVWTAEQLSAVREALPGRYAAMVDCGGGLGVRQGEIFALSPDDIEWLSPEPFVRIRRQVKVIGGGLVFDLPKRRKTRTVPLSPERQIALAEHMRMHPPATVTLPWRTLDGKPTTARLFFTGPGGAPLHRSDFNPDIWKPALRQAGLDDGRENGMHALRHYFASVLLTEGESIKAVSLWLGHANPTITLRVYAHFMPQSDARMRKVIDRAFGSASGDGGAIRPASPKDA